MYPWLVNKQHQAPVNGPRLPATTFQLASSLPADTKLVTRASMQSPEEVRNSNSGGVGMVPSAPTSYPYNPLYTGHMGYAMQQGYPTYGQYKAVPGHNTIDDLSNAFATSLKPVVSAPNHSFAAPPVNGNFVYRLQDGTLLQRAVAPQAFHPNGYMMPQAGQFQSIPTTPGHFGWGSAHEHGEAPGLARRNSVSSNEEVGPQTPFFPAHMGIDPYKRAMCVNGESPQAWSTPSPYALTYGPSQMPQQLMRVDGQYKSVNFDEICSQEPPIPKPVPAIFSSEKSRGTLDKCLKNETNTTNVYIRGLHPDTTDDMLTAYGTRFGAIMSAKSMLDQGTGMCKGFGFIKYHNFDDGENCIRGFFHMGYEAKWARVSHNERLKTLGDESNTNLYISNLPMTYNEQMLMSIFQGYEVMSSKILRDESGISRGVGFARFGRPEICAEIIGKFNGHPLPEGVNLSIRFADTPDQKKLKNLTAERRQFKTHEYNTAAFGPGSPYAQSASPATAAMPSPVQTRFITHAPHGSAHIASPVYSGYSSAYVDGYATTALHPVPAPARVSGGAESCDIQSKLESPSAIAHSKRPSSAMRETTKLSSESDEDQQALKTITNATRVELKCSPAKNTSASGSPTRLSPSKSAIKTTPSKTPRSKRV